MTDKFYPTAPVKSGVEEDIDEAVEAAGIIAQMVAGEDDKIILVSKQLAGRNCINKMNVVYDKVIAEQKALRSVSIAECKTESEYTGKLAEASVYADPAKWYTGIKAEKEVETWEELKGKLEPKELEVKEL